MSKQQSSVLFDALGPRGRKRATIASFVVGALIVAFIVYAVLTLASKGFFDGNAWATVFDAELFGTVWVTGLLGTLRAAALGVVGAVVLGLIVGMGRVSRFKFVRGISAVYVQFFRAIPLLLLIWIPYAINLYVGYADGLFGGDKVWILTMFVAIGLAVYNGAVLAEILRAGINALPSGQAMAGHAVGLTHGQVMRSIVMPQALRNMLPAVLAQLVILFKDTSLGYTIGYTELLHEARIMSSNYSIALLQILFTVLVVYFVIAYSASKLIQVIDRRMSRKTAGRTVGPDVGEDPGQVPATAGAANPKT